MVNNYSSNIIMSVEEQQTIINWANKYYRYFKPNGIARQYYIFDSCNNTINSKDIPPCIFLIKNRIIELENLNSYEQEPKLKDFISYITDQGQIHCHKDKNMNDLIHTRFNVIIQLPSKGGLPIYNDKIIHVNEREYIRCDAGIYNHYCEKVIGDKARIVISYGFLIPISPT